MSRQHEKAAWAGSMSRQHVFTWVRQTVLSKVEGGGSGTRTGAIFSARLVCYWRVHQLARCFAEGDVGRTAFAQTAGHVAHGEEGKHVVGLGPVVSEAGAAANGRNDKEGGCRHHRVERDSVRRQRRQRHD
jgi:hypothetical protein